MTELISLLIMELNRSEHPTSIVSGWINSKIIKTNRSLHGTHTNHIQSTFETKNKVPHFHDHVNKKLEVLKSNHGWLGT